MFKIYALNFYMSVYFYPKYEAFGTLSGFLNDDKNEPMNSYSHWMPFFLSDFKLHPNTVMLVRSVAKTEPTFSVRNLQLTLQDLMTFRNMGIEGERTLTPIYIAAFQNWDHVIKRRTLFASEENRYVLALLFWNKREGVHYCFGIKSEISF